MICQNCGEREATFHLSKTVNGEKTELHLCPRCAEQQGSAALAFQAPSIHQLLASLIGSTSSSGGTVPTRDQAEERQRACPGCGFTYSQFAHTGRMGCSQCYETFTDQLGPLLRKVHSATEHTGKTPKRAAGPIQLKREITALRRELQTAVAQEDFERAAQLRDRIRSLEKRAAASSAADLPAKPDADSGARTEPGTRPVTKPSTRKRTEEGSS